MLECRKARSLLNPFLEGDLEGPRATEMEAHLASCPTCRAEWEGFRRSLALLEGLPSLNPPRSLTPRVMAQVLRQGAAPRPARGRALGWVVAAVLGLLGAFLLVAFLSEQGWPWDAATLEALASQPVGLEALTSLLVGVEVGVVVGVTLLFVALASLLVQLMGRELQSQNGHV